MLSERQVARGLRPWWARWAPGLGHSYLGLIDNGGSTSNQISRWAPVIRSKLPARDADLISETAFGLFADAFRTGTRVDAISPESRRAVAHFATGRIMLLRGSGRDLSGVMSPNHLLESEELATRLLDWARVREHPVEIQPKLPGVGIVDACHPDMIAGPDLIEVKMASSLFRLDDIRQVLVYAALVWRGTDRVIETITLTNPRLGIDWKFRLREMVREISGKSLTEFFEEFEQMGQSD